MTEVATTPAVPKAEEWSLAVRVTVPIVSVLLFVAVQVILFFLKDPGYARIDRTRLKEDIEIASISGVDSIATNGVEENDNARRDSEVGKGLSKSSSTTCHMQSREEARKQHSRSRRTLSESDAEPVQSYLSETQAHLAGVLRLHHSRTRQHSTSSTGTSEDGNHTTFALSFGKKKRSRSRSTSEMHGPTSSPGPAVHDGIGLEANQLTISSIKEENEYLKDTETKF